MTDTEALELIKVKIGGEDSDLRNVLARSTLSSAIGAFNRIGQYDWNRQYVTFSLTNGTADYDFTTLWPEYTVRRLEPRIWFVGETAWINIIDYEQFNNQTRYRSTNSGTPEIATVHSKEGKIQIWPVPDSAYSCTAMLYVLVTSMDEIPAEYQDLVIDKAVMMAVDAEKFPAVWQAARASWEDGKKEIMNNKGYTVWTGNQIAPDPWASSSTIGRGLKTTDSNNLTGV